MKILSAIFVAIILSSAGCVSSPQYLPRYADNPPPYRVYYAAQPYYPYYPYYNARPYYHAPAYPVVSFGVDFRYVFGNNGYPNHRHHGHR